MSLLDQLYPQSGLDKLANADLSQISAADYLAALEAEEGGEEGELDLEQISAADFLAAIEDEDGEKTAGTDEDALLQAMIENGTFAEMDLAGRIMARAQLDELNKHAGADEIDLDELSAADLIELLESGEYELEKDAGMKDIGRALRKTWGEGKAAAGNAWKSYKADVSGATTGRILKNMGAKKGIGARVKMLAKGLYGSKGTRGQVKALRRATGKQVATGAALGAAGYGGYKLKKSRG